MLRDNLQPTDFADAEVRVSTWVEGEFHHFNAYRVWVCRCTNWWFQRHEWAKAGANSTTVEPWILQGFYPRKKWEPHLLPAPKDYDA